MAALLAYNCSVVSALCFVSHWALIRCLLLCPVYSVYISFNNLYLFLYLCVFTILHGYTKLLTCMNTDTSVT